MPLADWIRHPEFRRGAADMTGLALGIGAWGLVTGVAMIESGLPTGLMVLMSLVVFAGSAQLTALPLIVAGAPLWLIWGAACCVNLRFVIFSAGWRPYFQALPRTQRVAMTYFAGDLNYVAFMRRYPDPVPQPEQVPYFWGGAIANWVAWQGGTMLGIVLAHRIPTHWGIGFVGTLALLGMTWSLVTDRITVLAAAVAAIAAVAAYALPLRLNIVLAIAAAVAAGLLLERMADRGSR